MSSPKATKIVILRVLIALVIGTFPMVASAQSTPSITDVIIDGNANVDDTLIRSVAALKAENLYNPRDVATTIKQLYRLGLFSDIKVLAAPSATDGVNLTISVREYPLLQSIDFKGNDKIKTKDLERENLIFQGQAVSPFRVNLAKDKLLKLYREKGYLLAEVDERILVTEGTAVLELNIGEGKKVKLGEIFIEGNTSVPERALSKAMKNKRDQEDELFWKEGDLRRERILDTYQKATAEYRKHGFRSARVTSDSLWYSDDKSKMYMKINVAEGDKSIMGDLTFDGNTVFTDKELSNIFGLKRGEVFNEEKYGESLGKLYETYGELGYLYANPFPQEVTRGDSVDVVVSLNEGSPAKVHRINIVGNTKTKDKVIRREMVMKPGQVFRRSSLMRSQRDIFQLNFFQDVVPDIQPLPDGDVDVTVQVQEKPTGTANAGAGFSGLDGLVGTVSVVIPNFRGNGQTANFSTEFGSRRNSVSLGFVEPWLFDSPTSAGIDLFRTERFWFTEFKVREIGFGASVGRRIRNSYFRINGGYRLSNLEYDNFHGSYSYADEATMTPIFHIEVDRNTLVADTTQVTIPANVDLRKSLEANSGVTSTISNGLIRDSRNFPQFATSGMRQSIRTQVAGLGGDIKFFRQVYTNDIYVPLVSGTSISFKSKFGYTANPFNSRGVPFNERYFPGGISFDGALRGYGNNSVGPYTTSVIKDASGKDVLRSTRIGGRSMLIYTLEIQVPIVDQRKSTSPVYGLAFIEAGNAWDRISQTSISLADMKKSAGLGIRVVMPLVGIMGFDFGYGFNPSSDPVLARDKAGNSRPSGWNTHFQLGQQF